MNIELKQETSIDGYGCPFEQHFLWIDGMRLFGPLSDNDMSTLMNLMLDKCLVPANMSISNRYRCLTLHCPPDRGELD